MKIKEIIENWISESHSNNKSVLTSQDDQGSTVADFLGKNTSNPNAKGIEIYSNPQNLPTAIASILNKCQNKANFHPAIADLTVIPEEFNRYIIEVDKTPFVHMISNEKTKQKYDSKDYNKLIDNVISLYDGVSEGDKNKLKKSMADMAKSVFSESKAEQFKSLFSQQTIDYSDPRNPKLYIYYTTLHMKTEKNGKSEVNLQEYTVNQAIYTVLGDLIVAYAKTLASLDEKSIDEWKTDGSSPERKDPKLCFEVEKVMVN